MVKIMASFGKSIPSYESSSDMACGSVSGAIGLKRMHCQYVNELIARGKIYYLLENGLEVRKARKVIPSRRFVDANDRIHLSLHFLLNLGVRAQEQDEALNDAGRRVGSF